MSTSSTVAFYKGYYAGGKPVVLSANPFDVAQDLSTGNLWQYTGAAWVAPSWQTSITFWLGAGDSVCARLNSEDTRIPDTIQVYYGTDDQVPAELALSADDVAINHNVGNYNLNVNVLRKDVTTDTFVDVPFPEGYVITTEDGNWTILKNFNKCVGYDYATVSLAWTTTADGQGPQSVDYVTSGEAREIAEDVVSSGVVSIEGGNGINVITSGGSSVVRLATSASFDDSFIIAVADPDLGSASLNINTQGINLWANGAGLSLIKDECVIYCSLIVSSAIMIYPADGFSFPISLTTSAGGLLVDDQPLTTKYYVDSAIAQIPIVSGALTSGAEFVTQVGDYTLSYTSGGLAVSGSGASVALSGGQIAASIPGGHTASFSDNGLSVYTLAKDISLSAGVGASVNIHGDQITLISDDDHVTINGQTLATEPWVESQAYVNSATARQLASAVVTSGGYVKSTVEALNWTSTSGYIPVLSGGTCYNFLQPISALRIDAAPRSLEDATILCHFSGGTNFLYPSDLGEIGSVEVSSGFYRIAVNAKQLIAAPVSYTAPVGIYSEDGPEGVTSTWVMRNWNIENNFGNRIIYNGGAASNVRVVSAVDGRGELQVSGGYVERLYVGENGFVNATGGTIKNLTVADKGSAYIYGAEVDGLLLVRHDDLTPRVRISKGGIVRDIVTSGVVEFWFYGGRVENADFGTGAYIIMSSASIIGGTFAGSRLSVKSGGVISGMTIAKKELGEILSNGIFTGGVMSDCLIAPGGIYILKGGDAFSTTIRNSGARFVVSGGTASRVTISSGGTLTVSSGGTALAVTSNAGAVVVSNAGAVIEYV